VWTRDVPANTWDFEPHTFISVTSASKVYEGKHLNTQVLAGTFLVHKKWNALESSNIYEHFQMKVNGFVRDTDNCTVFWQNIINT